MLFIEVKTNLITFDQTACTDKCSDEYLQESGKLYGQLEACLAGLVLEPEIPSSELPYSTTTAN